MINATQRFLRTNQHPDPKPAPEVDPEPAEGTPEIEPPISPVVPIPNII